MIASLLFTANMVETLSNAIDRFFSESTIYLTSFPDAQKISLILYATHKRYQVLYEKKSQTDVFPSAPI